MGFIGKKILLYFFNAIKIPDIIIFKFNNKRRVINSNNINYDLLFVRDIKIAVINYYLNQIGLKKSFKDQLFNYLYTSSSIIHKKACLIKYLSEKKFNFDEIDAPFLSRSDLALFIKYKLRVKKIKRLNIKFKPNLSFVAIFLLLKHRKEQNAKLIEYFSKQKSKFNPKTKYYTLCRFKNKHSEDIYLEKLNKSLNNTIIYITPYLSRLTFRLEQYLKYLKTINRNYYINIPRINILKAYKEALNISFSSFPHELKIALFDIIIQRIKIDDLVKTINKNFPDIHEFYTDDNYNLGKIYLTKRLKEFNIKVICFSHGIDLQSPLVNFDVFYVFTKVQRSCYFGPSRFKYYKSNENFQKKNASLKEKFALFFVCQNYFTHEILEYRVIYQEVINYIEQLARDYDFPVYAKYHPGSTKKDKALSEKITIVDKIEDLPSNYKYLAVTFDSTYVIELLDIMPFLIINPQNKKNLKYYFPNDDRIYINTYQEFKDIIEKFVRKSDYFSEYWVSLSHLI